METVATCSTTDGNGSCHGLSQSFFDDMSHCRHKKSPTMTRQPHWSIEIPQFTFVYVNKIATNAQRRLRGWRRLLEITQTACYQRQIHRRRWPGNPSGRSKSPNLRLFMLVRSQWRLRGWWQLPEIAQTAHCRRRKHRWHRLGDDQDRSKFHNYENLCLWDQEKPLVKHLFAVRMLLLWWHCALLITRNGFCSHLWKIISRRPWLPPKNEIYIIKSFF